ncbi:MAG: PAS domain-containing protein [Pseudomonadota bacterium]
MDNYEQMTRAQLIAALSALAPPTAAGQAPASVLAPLAADRSPVAKWICLGAGLPCVAVNDAALACFGLTRAHFLTLSTHAGPDGALLPPCLAFAAEFGRPDLYALRDSQGVRRQLQVCHVDIDYQGRPALLMLANDVSRQLMLEADLNRIKEWVKHSQAYAKFGIWECDIGAPGGGAPAVSAQLAALFGYADDAPVATRAQLQERVHPDERDRVGAVIAHWTGPHGPSAPCADHFDLEYRIVRPDGAVRWMVERGGIVGAPPGARRVLGVVQDITRQKQSEQALRESEHHFRLFAENIREMIWVGTPSLDRLLYISPACVDILGLDAPELHGGARRWKDLVCADDQHLMEAALAKQVKGEAAEVEARIIRPDGRLRWIRMRSFPVMSALGERMASGIAEDVTDRKQLEQERIVQSTLQRDALVREVHHRIKNNLQGVAGLLRQHSFAHPEVAPIIDQAIAQVRAVAVVHGLQGTLADHEIVLCEMVPAIGRAVASLLAPSQAVIAVNVDVPERIRVSERESVPIALIVNELIMNAGKHAVSAELPARIAISVSWDAQRQLARISVVNPGSLPPGFAFGSGRGTGIGHELVRALLPPNGGSLAFAPHADRVEAVLELSAPCIYTNELRGAYPEL